MSHKLQKDDVSVAILAGGKSSRMEGKDKGLIRFNGKLVLSRIISIANEFSSDVFVIANNNLKEYEKIRPTELFARYTNNPGVENAPN